MDGMVGWIDGYTTGEGERERERERERDSSFVNEFACESVPF